MKTSVIVFPGSNCDRDAATTVARVTGKPADMVWHGDHTLPVGTDVVILPGGFSYGDYLRSGAMAARSPIMDAVKNFAAKGGYVLGICNGFQVLTETGLLPGTLMRNRDLKFICKNVELKIANNNTRFTSAYQKDACITVPIAHHDGNYVASEETLKSLKENDQIAFYYQDNPNGSCEDIAGIFDKNHRILGMMPHPERVADPKTGGVDGIPLFETLLK